MKNIFTALTFFSCALFFQAPNAADNHATNDLTVVEHSAWVRATPPNAKTTAIYLTVNNSGADDLKLISATSEISSRLELHTHKQQDGMMKMQQVEFIAIPSGGSAMLAPHGNHIMVFNPANALSEGDTIELTLAFDDGTEQIIEVPVLKEGPTDGDQTMHHTRAKKENHKEHNDDHKNH